MVGVVVMMTMIHRCSRMVMVMVMVVTITVMDLCVVVFCFVS